MAEQSSREIARTTLARVLDNRELTARVLGELLPSSGLSQRDKSLATEMTYGVLRHLGYIDFQLDALTKGKFQKSKPFLRHILRLGVYQLLFLDNVPSYAAIDEAVERAKRIGGRGLGGLVNGVLRNVDRGQLVKCPPATAASLSSWLFAELEKTVGQETLKSAAKALLKRPRLAFRPRGVTADELVQAILRQKPDAELELVEGLVLAKALGDPAELDVFASGQCTIQDPSSVAVALAARVPAGGTVLDLCAGRGGKSFALYDQSEGSVTIEAVDISSTQVELFRQNASRLGIDDIEVSRGDVLDESWSPRRATYDLVLVDAPCSGIGVLRRHPEKKWHLTPSDITAHSERQLALLARAAQWVAPDGKLLYAVCSFVQKECEEVVAEFAETMEFAIEATFRTWPHTDDSDAFFVARLVRPT